MASTKTTHLLDSLKSVLPHESLNITGFSSGQNGKQIINCEFFSLLLFKSFIVCVFRLFMAMTTAGKKTFGEKRLAFSHHFMAFFIERQISIS